MISRQDMADGTASVIYSRSWGTNWIEWYGPAIETSKNIALSGAWTDMEWDYTRWAYSRQVSAPGNTAIEGYIWVLPHDALGEGWSVHCQWTCTWTLNGKGFHGV